MNGAQLGRKQLIRLAAQFTTTDLDRLDFLLRHRFASAQQLARQLRDRHRTERSALRQTNRSLVRLRTAGLAMALGRRVGGVNAGSGSAIWTVTNTGARLLSLARSATPSRARYRDDQPSLTFLEHTLAVTEVHVRLAELQSTGQVKVESVETEPSCWRPYLAAGGHTTSLKPDLSVITSTPTGFEDHWYLEIDLATETPARVVTKCLQYQAYRQTGTEQRARGVFPRVVWIVPSHRRAAQLRERLAADTRLDPGLLAVVTLADFPDLIRSGAAPSQ